MIPHTRWGRVGGSLIPRPFKRKRRKGLVHTARACTGVSIATGRVTIVIVCGFCMTYSSMGDKRRVYDRIVSAYPTFFWGPPAHARAMCTRSFLLLLLKGLGTRLKKVIPLLTRTLSAVCPTTDRFQPYLTVNKI